MPPVLDIALDELVFATKKNLVPEQRRFGMDDRHGVLQLVAETECPA